MGHSEEDISAEELLRLNEDKIDAVIDLLMKKKIITENELSDAMDALYNEKDDRKTSSSGYS